jgi:serine/threonine protein kinase
MPYIAQIATAIDFFHNLKFIHRDIKPENILLKENGSAVLADFGASALQPLAKTDVGTGFYKAPEIENSPTYDDKIDVYSLGVILYLCFNNSQAHRSMYFKSQIINASGFKSMAGVNPEAK